MKNEQNIVLKGRDVYAQIVRIDQEPLLDKNKVKYMRFSYRQIAFIMRERQYNDFNSGNMTELTLVPTEREVNVVDPTTGQETGTKMVLDGYSYGGHLDKNQDLTITGYEAEKEAIRLSHIGRLALNADVANSLAAQFPNLPIARQSAAA